MQLVAFALLLNVVSFDMAGAETTKNDLNKNRKGSGQREPADFVAQLQAFLSLSLEQQSRAGAIFAEALGKARAAATARDAVAAEKEKRQKIREILTPEQRNAYDRTPISQGGASIVDPRIVARQEGFLQDALKLSEPQMAAVRAIHKSQGERILELGLQTGLIGASLARQFHAEIAAILTPAQQATFEATPDLPPYTY